MFYHLVQLGCQMNRADSERIATVLEAMGYEACEREEDAQILGVVACSVRQKAIDKVYSKISKWNDWKRTRHLLTVLSGCILDEDREKFMDRFDLVFTIQELAQLPDMISQYGVASPHSLAASLGRQMAYPVWMRTSEDAMDSLPFVPGLSRRTGAGKNKLEAVRSLRESTLETVKAMQDALKVQGGADAVKARISQGTSPIHFHSQGTDHHHHAHKSPEAPNPPEAQPSRHDAEDAARASEAAPVGGFWKIKPHHASAFEAFVPIQNGCDKFCTFCAVPYTRGREVSRDGDEIIAEVRSLVESGYTSITLLGQNVNSWGKDRPDLGRTFAWLLDQVGQIQTQSGKKFWVYFTSPHPRDMNRDVLEVMARHDCLAKQIHLPLQSGDDKVLLRMNRNHSLERYRELVHAIREILPQATLFTDIIVGFSGETEAQFDQTRLGMEEFQYQMAFIAMYSPRPGAASSRWEDDVALDEKKRRLQVLTQVLHQTSLAYNQTQLGREQDVLIETADPQAGWLSGRTEGRILVRMAIPDALAAPQALVGSFARVRITSVQALSMEGVLV